MKRWLTAVSASGVILVTVLLLSGMGLGRAAGPPGPSNPPPPMSTLPAMDFSSGSIRPGIVHHPMIIDMAPSTRAALKPGVVVRPPNGAYLMPQERLRAIISSLPSGDTLESLIPLLALPAALVPADARAGGTQVYTNLRQDLSYVYNSQAVAVELYAAGQTAPGQGYPNDYTSGWSGIYPGYNSGGEAPLVQTGLITDLNGVRWFAYSVDGGMTCAAGTPIPALGGTPNGNGCEGDYGSYASLDQRQYFAMGCIPSAGYWDVRVYAPGSSSNYIDVAEVPASNIVHNYSVLAKEVGEESYGETYDPHITMSFFHYHPQYVPQGQSTYTDWPASPSLSGPPAGTGYGIGPDNSLNFSGPGGTCPGYYGAQLDEVGDPRYWWTGGGPNSGDGGASCSIDPQF